MKIFGKVFAVFMGTLIFGLALFGCEMMEKEHKITVESPKNGTISVKVDDREVETGAVIEHNKTVEVTAIAAENFMLEELKVGGVAVPTEDGKYSFKLMKNTTISATFKPGELEAVSFASLGLVEKEQGMGNFEYAEGKVSGNIKFSYSIPRSAADKRFTRLFKVEKVGDAGDAGKVALLLSDYDDTTKEGDIWNVGGNVEFAKKSGHIFDKTAAVPAHYVGYWSNASVGNALTAATDTDKFKDESISPMVVAEQPGTYKITLEIIEVTDLENIDFEQALVSESVIITVVV